MFPRPKRPITHERTLELYQQGMLSPGFVRHVAKGDDILNMKLDRIGVPSKAVIDAEMNRYLDRYAGQ